MTDIAPGPKPILSSRTMWWLGAAAALIEVLIQFGVLEGWEPRIGQAVAALGMWLRLITDQPVAFRTRKGLIR